MLNKVEQALLMVSIWVSFADSARADKKKPYMDIDNGYTRVGFVPAVQYGDTLFVLTGKYKV